MSSSNVFTLSRRPLVRLSLALALAVGVQGGASGAPPAGAQQLAFDIAAGPLDEVLLDISRKSGVPISFSQSLVQDKRSPAIRGVLGGRQAVDQALRGSGLEAQHSEQGLTIRKAAASAKASPPVGVAPSARAPEQQLAKVTVTGSRIARAQSDGATPVNVITHQEMEARGYRDVYDALATQTQNTGMTQGEDYGNTFQPAASALNLRGWGPTTHWC
ncbi:hypothetical protein BTN82_17880 [Pseudomonas chlororaphis]|uniref:Secretin/TonB short N-terminal domain-containing protein n=1 Tax=Pseudomonas chlororaphis TaxID=587753 RepID=A0A1Q8ENH0_9PSED|nr:hypothetical protein BTN82_17880 [Pseudomonas chlororaphis]